MRGLAAVLLLLGLIRHEIWGRLPDRVQALAWNALGALTISALLLLCIYLVVVRPRFACKKSKALYMVLGWWLYEEVAVIGCSSLRMVWSWQVLPGQAQCDAISQLPVSLFSVAIIAAVAVQIRREMRDHDQS